MSRSGRSCFLVVAFLPLYLALSALHEAEQGIDLLLVALLLAPRSAIGAIGGGGGGGGGSCGAWLLWFALGIWVTKVPPDVIRHMLSGLVLRPAASRSGGRGRLFFRPSLVARPGTLALPARGSQHGGV